MHFILLILRSDVLTSNSVSTVVLTLGKVGFFKYINLIRNILFTGFVKFEIKQWFSAYQDNDQVCA